MVTSKKWLKSGELEKTEVWINNQNLVPHFLLVMKQTTDIYEKSHIPGYLTWAWLKIMGGST